MTVFFRIVGRDLLLARKQGGGSLLVIAFFVMVIMLFPLGVGPAPEVLERISSGTIWVAALLAVLLSLDRLFQADLEDGSLDQLALLPVPLAVVVLGKVAAHWLTTGLPLILAAPVLAVLMQMPFEGFGTLVLSMALGTPTLSLIGAIGAALTVGIRRGGVLLTLIVTPLYIPVLIFGVGAIEATLQGFSPLPHLMFLAAILSGAIVMAPIAAGWALRLALD
ncbi:MAG: heme exporter protein CcmB [Minwuia sp.]|uniref:heme exporter protein CcmB n=1 Tax=Minwuia sp. TaxID=2493630 RepID=UPI003A8AD118